MYWVQDAQTGEWVYTDEGMSTPAPSAPTTMLTDDEPARYGPPTAGEPGGPALAPGPVYEPPAPKDWSREIAPSDVPPPDYDGGGYRDPNVQYIPPAEPTYSNEYPLDSADAMAWLEENVWSKGWTVNQPTGEIIDGATGEVKGRVPSFYRMN
jgi:hypothetical protein